MSSKQRPPSSSWDLPAPDDEPAGIPTLVGVSLVTGVVGLCCSGLFLTSIIAVITGQMALNEINDADGAVPGRGLAQAGRILGAIGLLLGIAFWVLVATGHSPLASRGKAA